MKNGKFSHALLAGAAAIVGTLAAPVAPATAEDSNAPRIFGEEEPDGRRFTYVCEQDAFSISIFEAHQGPDSVSFSAGPLSTLTVRSLGSYGDIDPNVGESFSAGGPVEFDPDQPNNGRLCDTNTGTVIGYGDSYYRLTHRNSNAWAQTEISVEGSGMPARFGSAASALNHYRAMLARNGGGQPLPMRCSDRPCNFSGSGLGNGGPAPSAPGIGRVSMTELAMSDLSGQDLFHQLRGRGWGSSLEDLDGLAFSWVTVMNSLGMINETALRQELNARSGQHANGTFVFKTIRTDSIDMLLPMEVDDEPQYLLDQNGEPMMHIAPVLMNDVNGSWPTSEYVDQSVRPVGPGGAQNPLYCAANDPANPAYVPLYMTDPEVVLELASDLAYLTEAQINQIEDKGWRVSAPMGQWSEAQWQASVLENPNLRRPTYDCFLADNGDRFDRNPQGCKTKDIAYYDALIARLFVLNPELASAESHPCHARQLAEEAVMSVEPSVIQDLPKVPAGPATGAPRKINKATAPKITTKKEAIQKRN